MAIASSARKKLNRQGPGCRPRSIQCFHLIPLQAEILQLVANLLLFIHDEAETWCMATHEARTFSQHHKHSCLILLVLSVGPSLTKAHIRSFTSHTFIFPSHCLMSGQLCMRRSLCSYTVYFARGTCSVCELYITNSISSRPSQSQCRNRVQTHAHHMILTRNPIFSVHIVMSK
jgi:hypothetical protein